MNEKFKELALKAGLIRYKFEEVNIKIEKFAELIVKECADIADINAHQWNSPGSYVKQHFGVEK